MMRPVTYFFMSLTVSPLIFSAPDGQLAGSAPTENTPVAEKPTVLLLHGMCRSRRAMAPLAKRFKEAGYKVLRPTYPSRKMDVQELSSQWLSPYLEEHRAELGKNWCVVTHSLGGIMMREWLAGEPDYPAPRAAVMLAPPNQGSELTDLLGDIWLYKLINGPVGNDLGTRADHRVMQLPAWPEDIPLCILAGNKSVNPLYSAFIPGADDGKVSLDRAKLEGMREFIEIPHSHPWMMARKRVAHIIIDCIERHTQ